jgi:hypothetical protein
MLIEYMSELNSFFFLLKTKAKLFIATFYFDFGFYTG